MLMHLIGFYAYFVVRQSQIREEMRAAIGTLPSQEFERFVFTMQDYEKIKVNDHEVKINGRMYDHSSPKFEGDNIILLARHDEAEDSLISFFSELIETASDDNKPVPSQLQNFLNLTFIPQSTLTLPLIQEVVIKYCDYAVTVKNPFTSIESPPPRLS